MSTAIHPPAADDPGRLLLAIRLLAARQTAAAEDLLHDVLADDPDHATALFLLGSAALADDRPAEAAALLARVVHLDPGHRDARLAAARALLGSFQPAAALAVLEPLAADHRLAAAQKLLGTAFNALKQPHRAAEALAHAVAADPADAEAALNLGNALAECGQPAAALSHLRRATALDPAMAEAHASLGVLLTEAGELPAAIAACQAAIDLKPDWPDGHLNLAVALLLDGQMQAGWASYEWRRRRNAHAYRPPAGPRWQGEALAGRILLVVAEQGLGDAIQFSRFLPALVAAGAAVVLECAPALVPLLRQIAGVAVVARGQPRPGFDLWIEQMSLPLMLGIGLADIPAAAGFLSPDPARAAHWDRTLAPGLRVGIACAGNPLHSNDSRRSVPLGAVAPVVAACSHPLVNLQFGPRAGELARLYGLADLSNLLADFGETAAVLSVLDLVVTADTAVAHLAGALGIPVWVMLPHAPDWRWLLGRDDSPWYSAMRLFRQATPGDWAGVAGRVAAALATVARPRYSIAMPPLTCRVAPVTQAASSDTR